MTPRHRSVPSAIWHAATVLVTALAIWGTSLPFDSKGEAATVVGPASVEPLDALLARRGKGLDRGTFDVLQAGPLPAAWVWVDDATSDGAGVEHWAIHASFVTPGPAQPSVSMTFEHRAEVNHATLGEFLAWIAATQPHVGDPAELLVYRADASPVGP